MVVIHTVRLKGAIPLRGYLRGASVCLLTATLVVMLAGCGQQPVAIVNGQKITRTEFINRLKQAAGKPVLADLLFRRLVEDEFTRSGLKLTDQEVMERVAELKSEFPNEEAFQQWLSSVGMTEQDLVAEMRHQIKEEKLRTRDVKYTEADLRKFFNENKARYDKPLRVTISQIVVSTKQEADKVYAELQKPGANFGALARQYSIDAMFRGQGGRLPELPQDRLMPPDLQPLVAKMKVGDVSKPVKIDENWYIVKLENRKAPEKASFEKVRAKVERDYTLVSAKPKEALYRDLAAKATVQVLDPDLAQVQEMFMPKDELPQFGGTKQPAGEQQGAPSGAAPKQDAPQARPAPAEGASGQQ